MSFRGPLTWDLVLVAAAAAAVRGQLLPGPGNPGGVVLLVRLAVVVSSLLLLLLAGAPRQRFGAPFLLARAVARLYLAHDVVVRGHRQ